MTEHEFKALIEAGIRDLMASRPIPYSDEGLAMIQKVVADVEASWAPIL